MKPKSMKTILLAALLAPGALFAQTTATTTPVGYTTVTLTPSKYNLMSLTMQNPTLSSGVIASANASSVTVSGASFDTLLTTGKIYILELANGTIQEVSSWTATTLNTPQNISAQVTSGSTTYKIREADTISSVFGADNSFGLKTDSDENPNNNDLILVPNAVGAFDTVYYFAGNVDVPAGYFTLQDEPANNLVLNYADGFFVQRQDGSDINLIVSGELKTTPTSGVLVPGYNFLGGVYPTGLTLGTSNLQASLTIATSEDNVSQADLVLFQLPSGAYRSAYYFNNGESVGWFDLTDNPADDILVDSGFLIQNKGATSKPFTINIPSFYSTL